MEAFFEAPIRKKKGRHAPVQRGKGGALSVGENALWPSALKCEGKRMPGREKKKKKGYRKTVREERAGTRIPHRRVEISEEFFV